MTRVFSRIKAGATTLRMEREENEHRLDLTVTEKVALAEKIEQAAGGRQGNPTGSNQYKSGNIQNFVPFQTEDNNETPKGKSIDIAAQAVGMNRETYRQAKAVVIFLS